jgi:hypothetical protein
VNLPSVSHIFINVSRVPPINRPAGYPVKNSQISVVYLSYQTNFDRCWYYWPATIAADKTNAES